jgi:hypothetical protein
VHACRSTTSWPPQRRKHRRLAQAARANAPADNSVKALLANHPAIQKMTAVKPTATFAGSQGRQIGLERLSFSVVRRDANGQVSNQCVTGADAADKALHGALVGDAHDH